MLLIEKLPLDICFLVFEYFSVEDLLLIHGLALHGGLTRLANIACKKIISTLGALITTGSVYIDPFIDNERHTYKLMREQPYRRRGGTGRFMEPASGQAKPFRPFMNWEATSTWATGQYNDKFSRSYTDDKFTTMVISANMETGQRSDEEGYLRDRGIRYLWYSPESYESGYGPAEIVKAVVILRSEAIAEGGALYLTYDTETLTINN